MRILICGSRYWTCEDTIRKELTKFNREDTVITGGCRGADKIAERLAKELGMNVEVYPADWSLGRRAGPLRNARMLKEGKPDLVIAFHEDLESSKGTKNMINQTRKANIPHRIVVTKK